MTGGLAEAALVGAGGSLGALLRFWVTSRLDGHSFPVGTVAVNVAGSFALAVVAFGGFDARVSLLVGTGACGAFTTFSTFSVDTVDLWAAGDRAGAALNAGGTLVAALGGVGLAWLLVG